MDISKIMTALCGFTLAICLTLSITTLTVLRNAVKENDAVQKEAQSLVDGLNEYADQLRQEESDDDSLPTSADPSGTVTVSSVFTVRESGGKIGVYTQEGYLIRLLDVSVDSLPPADREALRNGIRAESWKELLSLMEDYGG